MADTSSTEKAGSPVAQDGDELSLKGSSIDSEDALLAQMGYKQEFVREFTNLSTISFAFSIMGVSSSVASTINTPLLYGGGPASVVWCWFVGSIMCFTLGTSIAELVSAYPTSGGLYSATAYLLPKRYRGTIGFIVGWLNLLGQIAGVASTEFALAGMILSAVTISTDGTFVPTAGMTVGVYIGLLVFHGLMNCFGTRILAQITKTFVFVNLGSVLAIIIALLVTCKDKHPPSYVFTYVINESGWSSTGLSFLLGLLSVQWTMTDYDATAHISEEVKKASIAAPVAIFVAVIGTGVVGWVYNVVYVLCSGPLEELPGNGGYAAATIIVRNVGKPGFYALWAFVCFTANAVVATAMQANARTFYAFSRDRGLPDRGFFRKMSKSKIPINAVWLIVIVSILLGLLDFASYVAVSAIFSLCAIALDTSYIIPIVCKLIFRDHEEVRFKPGPFYLGRGPLMWFINLTAISWTSFVVVLLALPTVIPVTAINMNYAAPILGAVLIGSLSWYFLAGRRHYTGPRNILKEEATERIPKSAEHNDDRLPAETSA